MRSGPPPLVSSVVKTRSATGDPVFSTVAHSPIFVQTPAVRWCTSQLVGSGGSLQRLYAARATRSVDVPTGHHPFVARPDLVAEQVLALR
ncbi:hypothetical protein GCM10009769_09320 [Curtobacterium luteum]|uniref:Alpha/beta hydrolase n=1 Tax=Curtobacterium luteum TaxID=33881 RepID=A0A8H9KXH9_9MICO|nr:hypothetical protein GCM10009769_09320 [Curtobacterium luteum]